jgi:hypothetical protein
MTDDDLNQESADTGTDTTGSADKAPASAPAPEVAQQHDGSDIDLLDLDAGEGDDGVDAGADASAAQPADNANRPAWQRPDGIDGDDLSAWKEQQGLPVEAAGYEVRLGEGETFSEFGNQMVDGLRSLAVDLDMPAAVPQRLVEWYREQERAHQARLAENDKALRAETRDVLTERWGDTYADRMTVAKEGVRVLPQALRAMLKDARAADGRRITHTPEFAQALFEIGRLRTRNGAPVQTTDDQRLTEISQVMNSDIDRYRREGLDKEHVDLLRKRDATAQARRPGTLTPAETQEEAELVQMMHTDIDAYRYRPYRGTGRPAADRLLQLQRKRDGAAA